MAYKADIDRLVARINEIAADAKLQGESLREELMGRLSDLEEAVANPPDKEPVKDPKEEVISGFVPHSIRKRNAQRVHRKKDS